MSSQWVAHRLPRLLGYLLSFLQVFCTGHPQDKYLLSAAMSHGARLVISILLTSRLVFEIINTKDYRPTKNLQKANLTSKISFFKHIHIREQESSWKASSRKASGLEDYPSKTLPLSLIKRKPYWKERLFGTFEKNYHELKLPRALFLTNHPRL